MLESGYEKFEALSDQLNTAKRERIRAQYYTGTEFLERYWKQKAEEFIIEVNQFVELVNELMGGRK